MEKLKEKGVKYSENINQANLWQFKNVIASGEVRFLLILDDYDELPDCDTDELSTAWHKIYTDFSEIVGGNRADLWLVKQRRLISMKLNYQIGATILRAVQICPVKETITAAAEFGYLIDINDLKPTFEKAYTRLMRLKGQISVIESESKLDKDEKDDLEGLIATLEKYQGYQFDELKMSVRKFANIYKNYKDARQQAK